MVTLDLRIRAVAIIPNRARSIAGVHLLEKIDWNALGRLTKPVTTLCGIRTQTFIDTDDGTREICTRCLLNDVGAYRG